VRFEQRHTGRYVQLLVGHGFARIEVTGNAYLEGVDRLDADDVVFLESIGFHRPDEHVDRPFNWWRVDSVPDADVLADTVTDLVRAASLFEDRQPVLVEVFGADAPCAACATYTLGSDDQFCVLCDSAVVPIVYGMPGSELLEVAERGEVILGGCVLPAAGEPTRSCQCGQTAAHDR
jgi:hypothetical protein